MLEALAAAARVMLGLTRFRAWQDGTIRPHCTRWMGGCGTGGAKASI
ncbi:MAG TPA: hypothetical protein VF062_21510 [Candidatus Limnocylindrales bacterium]